MVLVLNSEQQLLSEELKCTHVQDVTADGPAGQLQVLRLGRPRAAPRDAQKVKRQALRGKPVPDLQDGVCSRMVVSKPLMLEDSPPAHTQGLLGKHTCACTKG